MTRRRLFAAPCCVFWEILTHEFFRMSFSAEWLSLREPEDHRARDGALLREAAAAVAGRDAPLIVDLGCGTGSNIRALASHLPPSARLRVVDRDPALLAHARQSLGERNVQVVEADLSADLRPILQDADLVTGAALIDLCSADWLDRLLMAAPPAAAFYFALSYDGRERRVPVVDGDRLVHGAFLRHQQRDKGFGPALGPGAAVHLAASLIARGYSVRTACSDWRLTADEHEALIEMLDQGVADAAEEEGADVALWRQTRRTEVTVGHIDLLGQPPR